MEIELIPHNKNDPRNLYRITVTTMQGDCDAYNTFTIDFKPDKRGIKKLRQTIIELEIIRKQYENGMGGGDNYEHLPFWKKYAKLQWASDPGCQIDSFEKYEIVLFHHDKSKDYVYITADKEMVMEIKVAPMPPRD